MAFARFYVKIPGMPRASHLRAFKMALAQRSPAVHTGIRQRVIFSVRIEQGHSLAVDVEAFARTFGQFGALKSQMPHLEGEYKEYPADRETDTADGRQKSEACHAVHGHQIEASREKKNAGRDKSAAWE